MTTLTRLDCGEIHGNLAGFEEGSSGPVTLSVNAWLIHHPRGTVLFDVGMPASFAGGSDRTEQLSEYFTIGFDAKDTIGAQLISNDQDPAKIDFVVVSHLHFDHVGGLAEIPNATVIIQRKEWEANMAGPPEELNLHPREDFDLGHTLRLIEGEYDVFGDGSLMCIPTPGHTIGHQSLRLKLSTGENLILTSDCCCFARTIDTGVVQAYGYDLDEQRRSLEELKKCRDRGAIIIPGHDIEVVKRLPRKLGSADKSSRS